MSSPNTKRNPDKEIEENELYSTPTIALKPFIKSTQKCLTNLKCSTTLVMVWDKYQIT